MAEQESESIQLEPGVAPVPVVAIGASAGGLEALRQLFAVMPDDTGLAFIVIQHLDPTHRSMLASVLANDVKVPVVEVAHGMRAEPDRVHVIPPGADLTIEQGVLKLRPREATGRVHLPIDTFFTALAEDQPGRAIAVVLSGTASDGTEGLRAIKAAGGITLAQSPESAQFRGMPESAIAAGVVDLTLSPEEIGRELTRLSRTSYLVAPQAPAEIHEAAPAEDGSLPLVLAALRKHARLDFSGYKRPTVRRRIERRMALRQLLSARDYAELVREDPQEARALAEDILIHVTSFFRDPAAFEVLERRVLPELLKQKEDDGCIRVWVPGCSTGEEAYSVAICLLDAVTAHNRNVSIKVFGTDLSARAIDVARAGTYPEANLEGVSPERVARYFERVDGRYRVTKQVRELCVFVRHDLTRDPPFARLDLISCRNVLIYFDIELQRRIVPLFHHCLARPGYLFLGTSESIGGYPELFAPVEPGHRIYLKTGESPRIEYPVSLGGETEVDLPVARPSGPTQQAREAQRQADHVLLARYAPPGVVVDERLEVVQFRGRTGTFLEPAPGQPQTSLLRMARQPLVAPLREALDSAKTRSVTVRREGVRLDEVTSVAFEVIPLAGLGTSHERYFLIVFEEPGSRVDRAQRPPPAEAALAPEDEEEVTRTRAELAATRDYLQAIMGEHQDTTEALAAANEELVSANEELQSTNEELQSAKEELQSTNEELSTVNDELRYRNQELDVVATDLVNLLESVQIPVVMVDRDLKIRRFTPTTREVSTLLPADIGRSIDDVKLKVEVPDLAARIRATVDTVTTGEWEVERQDGRWFRLGIRPYRTADHRLNGAILSFVDIDGLKRAVQEAERARDYAQRIVETVPLPVVVLDSGMRIVSANSPFHLAFGMPASVTDTGLLDLAAGAWNVPRLREAIEASVASGAPFGDLEIQCTLPSAGRRDLLVAGCPLQGDRGDRKILLAIQDITERRMLEASERQARVDAEQANRAKDLFLATLSHELRTPLGAILMSTQVLQKVASDDARVRRASAAIERAVTNQARLIDDLLDISRIVSGKLMLDLQAVDLATVVMSAVDVARGPAEAKQLELAVDIRDLPGPIHGDPSRLQQIVANLLNNSIKFTPRGGRIEVRLEPTDGQARIVVRDNGMGIRADVLPHLFNRFVQAESSMTRAHGGLGLGLAIVAHLVTVHGGEVRAESPGEGRGATVTVTLPLASRESAAAAEAPRAIVREISGIRVLLVEDDDDTREACTMMLEQLGAVVQPVASVPEALAAVEPFSPQVILCDLAMPGEDGFSFIRTLRRRAPDDGGQTPAAALTALAGEEDRKRALQAGFQLHLSKPIDAAHLAHAVGSLAAWGKPPAGTA